MKTFSEKLMEVMKKYMIADAYGRSTVCSLYFDTPDYLFDKAFA